jgi:putative endonuclease
VQWPARHASLACEGVAGGRSGKLTMYYTYVLQSLKDSHLYIGWTDDLKHRVSEHSKGKVESTSNRLPVKLVYYEACLNKTKAILREKYFKTGFGRRFLKNRI